MITKSQLKKFKVVELKQIIRDNKIGKVGGNKAQLMTRIIESDKWNEIKEKLNVPEKKKKKFSAKQLAAQQKFKDMVAKRQQKKKKPKPMKPEPDPFKDEFGEVEVGTPVHELKIMPNIDDIKVFKGPKKKPKKPESPEADEETQEVIQQHDDLDEDEDLELIDKILLEIESILLKYGL